MMTTPPNLDVFGLDYLRLALRIDRHIDGYIDAYIGPPELKAQIKAEDLRPAAHLLNDLASLREKIPTADTARFDYVQATLRAMDCTLRILDGERFDFLDEVNRLYDVQPQPVPEEQFTQALNEMDSLLPGTGPLAERVQAHREHYELESDRLLPLLELARQETRARTAALFPLPPEESVELKIVSDKPWSAYNWYLGGGKSLIEFNTDLPVSALVILDTFAHEGYPGHHTEAILKDELLYRKEGFGEMGAALLSSPGAVIAEGIATTAAEIIFPADTQYEWIAEVLLPAAGLAGESAEKLRRLRQASNILRYVSGNAAILHFTGQLNREQVIDYLMTYTAISRKRAEKVYDFIVHPLSRGYVFTYTSGYDLIAAAADENDKEPVFRRCLLEQILPSQLA